jgi:hypothetical protein
MTSLRNKLAGALPADLSERIAIPGLMGMVFEAMDATQWPRPLAATADRTPEPVLRTVMIYCYATGVYSSGEIEGLARRDESVRYLCANDFPKFEEIRQFRRRHVSWLRESLARVLHAAWIALYPEDASMSFLPFVAEADYRLSLAVEADSAAMDD